MQLNHSCLDDCLLIFLEGEIDHHKAPKINEAIDELLDIEILSRLILDFSKVTFMDSSGIGIVLGRYKLCKARGIKLEIINTSTVVKKIFELSGVTRLIDTN